MEPLRDISDAIWIIAPDSTLDYMNRAAAVLHAELYGARAQLGTPVTDLYPPDVRDRWIEHYKAAAEGQRVMTVEVDNSGDEERHYELVFDRGCESDEGYPVVVVGREITGRAKTVAATGFEARAVIDTDTYVLYASPQFKELLGLPPDSSIGSIRMRDTVDPDDEGEFLEAVARASRLPRRIERLRIVDMDGATHVTVAVVTRSPDSGNLAVALLDISSQIETERQLEQNAEHLQALHAWAAELNVYLEEPGLLYRRSLELLSNTVRFDSASVQVLSDDRLCIVACAGFDEPDKVTGLCFPFQTRFPNWHVVTSRETIAVTDVREEYPHFHGDADQFSSGNIAAWLGVPLTVRDDVVGMIALDRADAAPFSEEEQKLVRTMAGHIAVAVHNSQLFAELHESEERLSEANQQKETLLRELHHRSKNNMQMISSLLSLGAAAVSVEEDGQVLDEVRMRIQSLSAIHEELYRAENLDSVDLSDYATRLTRMIADSYGRPGIRASVQAEPIKASIDVSVPFGLILSELVLNAYKHAFPGNREGLITVELRSDEGSATLAVADDGIGLMREEREQKRDSLGMQLVESLSDQIRGRVELDDGPGTTWRLNFPVAIQMNSRSPDIQDRESAL